MLNIVLSLLNMFLFVLQAYILEMVLCFDSDFSTTINSIIIVVLLCTYAIIKQQYYRRAFKTGHGRKRYSGYVNYNFIIRYFLLFLTVQFIAKGMNVFAYLIMLYICLKSILDLLMEHIIMDEVSRFKENLSSDSKIIIFQKSSCLLPGGFWKRWFDILVFPLLMRIVNYELIGTYRNYISINNITALICEDLMVEHPKYLFISRYQFKSLYGSSRLFRKKIVRVSLYDTCDRYLISKHRNINLHNPNIPYPQDKLQIFEPQTKDSNWISHIIRTIESLSKESTALDIMFRPFLSYKTKERGKRYVQRMIHTLLDNQQNDTEYFYSLLKINEFMIHYQALSNYESSKNSYWEEERDCTPSMGVFVSNITDTQNTELLKENKFKEAVRFLHYLSTNHSEKVPNKKVAHYAREQIIVLRNRYTGHGTMTYSVSQELLQQFAIVTQVLTEQFFLQEDNMMCQHQIASIDKWIEKNSCLYLLAAAYRRNDAYQYLDYATGRTLSLGNPLTIQLCRKIGGTPK